MTELWAIADICAWAKLSRSAVYKIIYRHGLRVPRRQGLQSETQSQEWTENACFCLLIPSELQRRYTSFGRRGRGRATGIQQNRKGRG